MEPWKLLVDGLIIVLYFIAITGIGVYMGRREHNLEDYALGGRRMPWWAVMASIIAAETSAATFVTVPGEGYSTHGLLYVQLALGLIVGRLVVGNVFLKPYYTYKVYTVYDFLAVRFGMKSRNCVSALFLVMRTLASGVRVFVPSLIMVLAWRMFVQHLEVKNMNAGESWYPYAIAIIVLTVLTCLYTTFGGIKAVIWTDVIQATLMFGSAIVAILTILSHIGHGSLLGGMQALFHDVPEMTKAKGYLLLGWEKGASQGVSSIWELFRMTIAAPYTIWAAVIGGTASGMASFGTDQDMVQRMLTASSYKRARRSLITAAIMDVPVFAAFTLIGVLLIVYYNQNPALRPEKPNDVFGVYILNVMPVVIRGFILAGLFATAMGSLSAALNALATSFTNDWYIAHFAHGKSEKHYISAARAFTALFAVLMIVIATATAYFNVKNPNARLIPIALGVAGLFLGPMLGIFLIGMLTKTRGSDWGNIIAIIGGLSGICVLSGMHIEIANTWVEKGYHYVTLPWMPTIGFTWYVMFGAIITFAIGVLFRTPPEVVESAQRRAMEADTEGAKPLALRETSAAQPAPKSQEAELV